MKLSKFRNTLLVLCIVGILLPAAANALSISKNYTHGETFYVDPVYGDAIHPDDYIFISYSFTNDTDVTRTYSWEGSGWEIYKAYGDWLVHDTVVPGDFTLAVGETIIIDTMKWVGALDYLDPNYPDPPIVGSINQVKEHTLRLSDNLGGTYEHTFGISDPSDYLFAVEVREPIPEPTTMLLFGTGLAGLAAVGRRRKK